MPIPTQTKTFQIAGRELVAEAMLNNCSDLWTATVQSPQGLVATAAGTSAEAALTNVIARAEAALGHRKPASRRRTSRQSGMRAIV